MDTQTQTQTQSPEQINEAIIAKRKYNTLWQVAYYRKKMDSDPEYREKKRLQSRERYRKKVCAEYDEDGNVIKRKPGPKRTILIN